MSPSRRQLPARLKYQLVIVDVTSLTYLDPGKLRFLELIQKLAAYLCWGGFISTVGI